MGYAVQQDTERPAGRNNTPADNVKGVILQRLCFQVNPVRFIGINGEILQFTAFSGIRPDSRPDLGKL